MSAAQTHRVDYRAAAAAALANRPGRHALRSPRHHLVRPYVLIGGVA